MFLAAVIVVALIALLFVSGIGEALALALLIVGVAFLVVGFVRSLINRWGTLRRVGLFDEQGPIDPAYMPHGLPASHWWWHYPEQFK